MGVLHIVRKTDQWFLANFSKVSWKILKILLYLLYFNVKISVYFIQNRSHLYEKFSFTFYKLKNSPNVFFEFRWISSISLIFPEILPTIYSKPEYFLKTFTFKICDYCHGNTSSVLKMIFHRTRFSMSDRLVFAFYWADSIENCGVFFSYDRESKWTTAIFCNFFVAFSVDYDS